MLDFQGDRRKSMLRDEHVLEHGAFEFKVVGDQAPARIARCFEKWLWYRLSREPSLHLAVVDCVANAQDVGRRMRGYLGLNQAAAVPDRPQSEVVLDRGCAPQAAQRTPRSAL